MGQPRERAWDVNVQADGDMGTAWMRYPFYAGDERSHCGVNSMHLTRRVGEWRILPIVYARRTECDVPANVRWE